MKAFRFFYRFTKGQQKGILALFSIIIIFQAGYYVISRNTIVNPVSVQAEEWLSLQAIIDSLKQQAVVGIVEDTVAYTTNKAVVYPFNPNYITDYKAYVLGLSSEEFAKLQVYRDEGKFIESAEDFKRVTGVHDTLLTKISPFFKFPDWVEYKHRAEEARAAYEKLVTLPIDINEAVEEDLVYVNGIGPVSAKKILRRRAQLGAYVSMEQLEEFKFSDNAVKGLKERFAIKGRPDIKRLNINTATAEQLSNFPYFNEAAVEVILKRRLDGKITDFDELSEINIFNDKKSKIIRLYLEY
ncbi:helix-hairpin-helix domain-containing protein [Flavobacterium rhizosphaerae]|uniref:Helix-hairpin-helix domain-containing protein n=1 Tax=Flavobacterium rhizosphaerae TaxID=3163298 RepID=A0ABW8YRB1_9FLAO